MERFSESEGAELWDWFEAGESLRSISRQLGRTPSSVRTHIVARRAFRHQRNNPHGEWNPTGRRIASLLRLESPLRRLWRPSAH